MKYCTLFNLLMKKKMSPKNVYYICIHLVVCRSLGMLMPFKKEVFLLVKGIIWSCSSFHRDILICSCI